MHASPTPLVRHRQNSNMIMMMHVARQAFSPCSQPERHHKSPNCLPLMSLPTTHQSKSATVSRHSLSMSQCLVPMSHAGGKAGGEACMRSPSYCYSTAASPPFALLFPLICILSFILGFRLFFFKHGLCSGPQGHWLSCCKRCMLHLLAFALCHRPWHN